MSCAEVAMLLLASGWAFGLAIAATLILVLTGLMRIVDESGPQPLVPAAATAAQRREAFTNVMTRARIAAISVAPANGELSRTAR